MGAHVLLNLLNVSWGKKMKVNARLVEHFISC